MLHIPLFRTTECFFATVAAVIDDTSDILLALCLCDTCIATILVMNLEDETVVLKARIPAGCPDQARAVGSFQVATGRCKLEFSLLVVATIFAGVKATSGRRSCTESGCSR